MSLVASLLQAGPFTSPPGILVGVALLALIILVGRFVLAMAWKLVLVALLALTALWVAGILGFETGILSFALPAA